MELVTYKSDINYGFYDYPKEIVQTKEYSVTKIYPSATDICVENSINTSSKNSESYYKFRPMSHNPTILRSEDKKFSNSNLSGNNGKRAKSLMNSYDPINDPHLKDYFERKFSLSSARRFKPAKKLDRNEAIYIVRVKTGNLANASTDSNVYLTIVGKGNILQKQRLFDKSGAVRTDNGYKYKFERNSTHKFRLTGNDVGAISFIIVQHDGKDVSSSWFLEEIIITKISFSKLKNEMHRKIKNTWTFYCHEWLSLYLGLYTTTAQLFPSSMKTKYTETDYEILIVTGDVKNASTNANVYITLFGTRQRISPRFHLTDSNEVFRRGQSDKFVLHSKYVGPLRKVRIEHDNSGNSPDWFLERIVITDLKDPKIKYFFPCGKWLAKNQGDGLISRDLIANLDPLEIRKPTKYRITTHTGEKINSGTDADVSCILYGNLGDSGEWKLNDKTKNNFEKGQKDEFLIECPSIGEIQKLRIGHNNKGAAPGWYLKKVIVDDLLLHKVYEFNCERWLAVDEGDGQTYVVLNSKLIDTVHGVEYIIRIKTGNKSNASTNAKVYIELFKEKKNVNKSSGMVYLSGEFKNGRTNEFRITVPEIISPLTHVIIGHDNSGNAPGWFCEMVEVECPSIGIKQFFPCGKWLAKDEGDGLIERLLYENTSMREMTKPKDTWLIKVYTSNNSNAGTDANVFIVLYGDEGKTDDIALRSKSNDFERGQEDIFTIETDIIGKPYKLRVYHDNTGTAPGWHLDRIEAENMRTKEHYLFRCNKWLAKNEGDRQIIRELPAEGANIRKPLPVVQYEVEVHTGDKRGAGTDANVFLNIFGEFGDTGNRPLESSSKNKNKFERNNVDTFIIESVFLKKLKKIIIGHDGTGAASGWFLNKVMVRQIDNKKFEQVFNCNRWLSTSEDDGLIVREITADGSEYLDKISYHVKVKTGDIANAGTDANVHLKITGTQGDTGVIKLISSNNAKNKFERGRIDEFIIEQGDIGKIEKIKIGHDGKGAGSGWFLDYVQIDVPSKGIRYMFHIHRWLDEKEEDGKLEIEVFTSEVKKIKKLIPYVVKVKTGDKKGAGTDANVFIQMYGIDGTKTEEIQLRSKGDDFERAQEDIFKIESEDIGPIYKVRIGHDNKGANSGWFLEKMIIQRHVSKHSKKMNKDESETEEYYFYVNRWFDKNEDDKQIIREISPTDKNGNPLFEIDEVPYMVKVYTGDKSNAGTDANVFLTIYGLNGDSGERKLSKSDHKNKFERNQIDTFDIKAIDLGLLQKIKIRHDDTGIGAAWYLEKVEIFNPVNDRGYLFNCQRWLATDHDDGKICRELPALDLLQSKHVKFRTGVSNLKDQLLLETEALTNTYNISVTTSDKKNAGTNANVYIELFGEKNQSGKIKLETSKNHKDKFERGQTDVFEIKEADVGELRKIKIGHDGTGIGAGWHLEKVIIDAPKLGRKWTFPCGRWLDKMEEDGKTEIELEPAKDNDEEYIPFVNYEIVVYTSDLRGADTSANPYIVLYGRDLYTTQKKLCQTKSERKEKFKRGSVDRFVLELEDIGSKIEKIRIGHDNSGLTAGWHVKKVEVRRLKEGGKGSFTYVFPCDRWLARDEDDGAIERDLIALKIIDEKLKHGELVAKEHSISDKLEMKTYTVDVYTGNVSGAGTNANVFITMYGDLGDSGEKKLMKSDTNLDKFERNQMDRFHIETADLGEIHKVKIRHDNKGVSADWFLDRIEIKDEKNTYLFICERWLSKSKEDKKIERTLYEKHYKGPRIDSNSTLTLKSSIGGSMKSLGGSQTDHTRSGSLKTMSSSDIPDGPTIPYTIVLKTGQSGTTAQIFINLIGEKGKKTGRLKLLLPNKKRIKPYSSETFSVEALDIGELRKIEVGHDGTTSDEGWFLEEIEVQVPEKGLTYFLTCNRWLSTDKDDGSIIRVFKIDDATTRISSYHNLIPFSVAIYTGDISKSGTDSNILLKLFGTKGATSEVLIEKIENRFERASEDVFKIDLEDIGSLKKLRVTADGKGSRKDWYLDRVEVTNLKTQKQYLFECHEWLSKNKDGSKGLTIDLPVSKGGKAAITKTNYKITVKTSDISGAGTDANVFLCLFGENGDSGELALKKSETHTNKFERNQMDVFLFNDILSLGELYKCRIWHDNSGGLFGSAAWHLESVLVEDLQTGRNYNFLCKKWLSSNKDDKQIVRELICTEQEALDMGTSHIGEKTIYEITVVTSDKRDAGTVHNAWIVLVGEKGTESRQFLLKNSSKTKILRRGQTDQFQFHAKSLGGLKKIIIGHFYREDVPLETSEDREGKWHCHEVIVKDMNTGTSFVFPIQSWIYIGQDEGKMFNCSEKLQTIAAKSKGLENTKYEVVVVTGKEKNAGTDANVFIVLYGENGDSGRRALKQSMRNLFERGQTDKFIIECIDLGELQKLHVEHDNSSFKKSWFLDRIEVKNLTTNQTVIFPCNKWLDKNTGDGEISRDLFPLSESGRDSRGSNRSRDNMSKSPRQFR